MSLLSHAFYTQISKVVLWNVVLILCRLQSGIHHHSMDCPWIWICVKIQQWFEEITRNPIMHDFFSWAFMQGVANGTWKIQGLENLCSDLEISEAFWMSLEILCSFLCVCVSDSRIFGRKVSESRIFVCNNYCWPTVSIKTMIKVFTWLKTYGNLLNLHI